MISRLAEVIHWLGFCCLALYSLIPFVLFLDGQPVIDVIDVLWFLLTFQREGDFNASVVFWIALSHWPIKYILTGDKSVFPWSKENNS